MVFVLPPKDRLAFGACTRTVGTVVTTNRALGEIVAESTPVCTGTVGMVPSVSVSLNAVTGTLHHAVGDVVGLVLLGRVRRPDAHAATVARWTRHERARTIDRCRRRRW